MICISNYKMSAMLKHKLHSCIYPKGFIFICIILSFDSLRISSWRRYLVMLKHPMSWLVKLNFWINPLSPLYAWLKLQLWGGLLKFLYQPGRSFQLHCQLGVSLNWSIYQHFPPLADFSSFFWVLMAKPNPTTRLAELLLHSWWMM